MPPSISIITVTYNAIKTMPDLIASLRSQTDNDFEWVVIDADSNDGTKDLIFNTTDVVSQWVSEPDCGIYHAINKALSIITGDYYLVVGSDDILNADAIENYKQEVLKSKGNIITASVFLGNTLKKSGCRSWGFGVSPPRISQHSVGTLIRSNLHKKYGLYNLKYLIVADLYFLHTIIKSGEILYASNFVAGKCGESGISSIDHIGAVCEWFRIQIEIDEQVTLAFLSFVYRITKHWLRYMVHKKTIQKL